MRTRPFTDIPVLRGGLLACSVAAASLFAVPVWGGLSSSPPLQIAPADAGRVPSGAIESGRIEPAEIEPAEIDGTRLLRIAPRDSRPFGKSYREWVAAWWKWAVRTKGSAHPLLDNGPCSENQTASVWFLGGDFLGGGSPIERNCTVPAGTALFIALTTESWLSTPEVACITADPWYRATPGDPEYALFREQILDAVKRPDPIRTLALRLNGRSAEGLRSFFVRRSTIFSVRLPEDSLYDALGVCPGNIPPILTAPDVAWGFHVFLKPLPVGKYRLRWKADVDHIDVSPGRQRQDVTYHLTVKASHR
jgi:hypothetical protein